MTIHNVIIIGSGPAGHTAAIYAARSNLKPIMFEGRLAGGIAAGGQLTTTTMVENFPGRPEGIMGPELMDRMRAQSIHSGTQIFTQTVDRVDFSDPTIKKVYSDGVEYLAKTVIIATGATAKKLPIEGLDTYWMNGISGCAVCDGAAPIFRNKPLAVIGGGDVALEEAMHLSKFGSKVYLIVRSDKLRASKAMQDKLFANEKIEILRNTQCTKADGDDLLQNIYIENKDGLTSQLAVNGLFFAIGHTPNTSFLQKESEPSKIDPNFGAGIGYNTDAPKKYQLNLDESGYIITTKGTTETSVPGVFAAGDVQDHIYRQAITSAGTGCMAALEAEKYISQIE